MARARQVQTGSLIASRERALNQLAGDADGNGSGPDLKSLPYAEKLTEFNALMPAILKLWDCGEEDTETVKREWCREGDIDDILKLWRQQVVLFNLAVPGKYRDLAFAVFQAEHAREEVARTLAKAGGAGTTVSGAPRYGVIVPQEPDIDIRTAPVEPFLPARKTAGTPRPMNSLKAGESGIRAEDARKGGEGREDERPVATMTVPAEAPALAPAPVSAPVPGPEVAAEPAAVSPATSEEPAARGSMFRRR
jgi:hypothetical protein